MATNVYMVAGIPFSPELYHHGIKGQKWGLRRFQNPDGTLTPLGKIRYAGEKVGEVGKKVGKAVANETKIIAKNKMDEFKMRHPVFVNNEELSRIKQRVDMEKSIAQARADTRKLNSSKTRELISDMAGESAKKIMGKITDKALDKAFMKRELYDLDDVLRNPKKYSAKDLQNAKMLFDTKSVIEKERAENKRYDVSKPINTTKMSKKELDNLNAWLSSEERTYSKIKNTKEYATGRAVTEELLSKDKKQRKSKKIPFTVDIKG